MDEPDENGVVRLYCEKKEFGEASKQIQAFLHVKMQNALQEKFANKTQKDMEENVELAAQVCKDSLDAGETLDKVGLSDRKNNFPAQLSGGEQQRVAIARAIAKNPKLLLCDEPTGALDYNTGKQILQLLQDTCRKDNITVLIITHNSALAPMADRLIRFKSGKVIEMTTNENPIPIAEIEW